MSTSDSPASDIFKELLPAEFAPRPGVYPTVADLLALDDLPEQDVVIHRWTKDGDSMRLRIRGLDLDQQQEIDVESLVNHKKTKQWVVSYAAYCAATIERGVIVPRMSREQAAAMRKHNPHIMGALVRYIWLLSALDQERIEKAAADVAGVSPESEDADDAGLSADGADGYASA